MSTPQTITHKQGATFGYAGFKLLEAGNWSAKCQGRDTDGALVQDFDVSFTLDDDYEPPVDQPTLTRYAIAIRASSADTAAWTKGARIKCDVAWYDDSVPPIVVPTDTFVVHVSERQTHVD